MAKQRGKVKKEKSIKENRASFSPKEKDWKRKKKVGKEKRRKAKKEEEEKKQKKKGRRKEKVYVI